MVLKYLNVAESQEKHEIYQNCIAILFQEEDGSLIIIWT